MENTIKTFDGECVLSLVGAQDYQISVAQEYVEVDKKLYDLCQWLFDDNNKLCYEEMIAMADQRTAMIKYENALLSRLRHWNMVQCDTRSYGLCGI